MFKDLVGQDKVKNKLKFFAKGKQTRGYLPAILMNGAAGLGKTAFATSFARHLKAPLVEINCGALKNDASFFEGYFMNYIADKEVTVLMDECHELPEKLMTLFLTVFNPEGVERKTLEWDEHRFEFNFRKQTFLFATTEAHQLFRPFKTRLNKVDFTEYNVEDLTTIMQQKIEDVVFDDEALACVGRTFRGNARSAIVRATEIDLHCEVMGKRSFDMDDWAALSETLDILPHGLTATEKAVLDILRARGKCTLQMLSAATGLSRAAVQQEAELHLLKEGLMKIDGKREITQKGQDLLEELG